MTKKVTIYTIAEQANVSPSTVSNVLHRKKGNYRPELEEKILSIAREMGYQSQQKTKIIRLMIISYPDYPIDDNPFHSSMVSGIKKSCDENHYQLAVHHLVPDTFETDMHRIVDHYECDGLLLVASILNRNQILRLDRLSVPFVLIDTGLAGQEFNSVSINNESTTFRLTEMMIEKHHKHIGFIGCSNTISNYYERQNGFMQAVYYYHLPHLSLYDIPAELNGTIDDDKLVFQLKRMMTLKNPPTAYCCANDFCALKLLKACKELNIHFSMTGFDNMSLPEPYHDFLTTVQINEENQGYIAAERLLSLIRNPNQIPVKTLVSTKIIERNSILRNY